MIYEILENRVIILIKGDDSESFLQSLVTNNIASNIYSYNYLLSNQGRFLADFFVYKSNECEYFIDVDKKLADNLLKRLKLYKLRSKIDLELIDDKFHIIYSKEKLVDEVIFSTQDPRSSHLGYRSIILSDSELYDNANSVSDLYYEDKYEFGIPDGAIDLEYEKSIPVEFGADELNAIDYKKGCYVGQEVISRVKYQGVVRKKIYIIKSGRDFCDFIKVDNAEVFDDSGNKLGKICSFFKDRAICLLREEKIISDKILVQDHSCDIIRL